MRNYLDELARIEAPVELFDRRLWRILIEQATITLNGFMSATFKDGTIIPG